MTDQCLGEGSYSARFVKRATDAGPGRILGALDPGEGSWSRRLNTTTDASAVFPLRGSNPECVPLLRNLDPWRDEMELWRDAGSGSKLVWAGPVTNVIADSTTGTATVTARDMSAWWAKRVLAETIVHRGADLAKIFEDYVRAAFKVDDPGIVINATLTGITGDRTVAAADLATLSTALEEIVRTGVDWCLLGRVFVVGGISTGCGFLQGRISDEHFRTAPILRRSGDNMANDVYVSGSNGLVGRAGGPDPVDGVQLSGVLAENSIEDQASADAAAEGMWVLDRYPQAYLEGENALAPGAPFAMSTLIPGVCVAAGMSGAGVVPLTQDLRLDTLSVTFGATSEVVTVAFQPLGRSNGHNEHAYPTVAESGEIDPEPEIEEPEAEEIDDV